MSKLINKYTDDYGCCSVCGSPSCSVCEKYDDVGSNYTWVYRFRGQWPPLKTAEQRAQLFQKIKNEFGLASLVEMAKHYRFDKAYKQEIEDATRGQHV